MTRQVAIIAILGRLYVQNLPARVPEIFRRIVASATCKDQETMYRQVVENFGSSGGGLSGSFLPRYPWILQQSDDHSLKAVMKAYSKHHQSVCTISSLPFN